MTPAPASKLKPWQRAISWFVRALVFAFRWGLGLAILLTGLVLWRDWHALAVRGIDATAKVEHCTWKTSGQRRVRGSGYYSCTYTYQAARPGSVHGGYFQSSRRWADGEPIPIRYLPDRPQASATTENLQHPSITTGAMIVLGLALLGWSARQDWKRRTASSGSSDPAG